MDDSLFENIRNQIKTLTKTQRIAADYIMTNPMNAAFLTVTEFAQTIGTSTTTIIRLAETLGFSGYTDMQKALQEYVIAHTSSFNRLNANMKLANSDRFFSSLLDTHMANLQKVCENNTEKQFMQARDLIVNAENVFTIGTKTSYSASYYLGRNLARLRKNCSYMNAAFSEVLLAAAHIGPKDVMIVFSMPRYSEQTVTAASMARERGAKIIAVTDGYVSPLAPISDVLLRVEGKSSSFHNSILPSIFVADVIIALVAAADHEASKRYLRDEASALNVFDKMLSLKNYDSMPYEPLDIKE